MIRQRTQDVDVDVNVENQLMPSKLNINFLLPLLVALT